MLKTPCFKGYVPADTEAEVIAFKALQEMQDRLYPKPLQFKEILSLLDQPVWVQHPNAPMLNGWGIVASVSQIGDKRYLHIYGKIGMTIDFDNIRVYRYKAAEVKKDV